MTTLAVFGGSFDPPHTVHVLAANFVLSTERIDRLLVVPTFMHTGDKTPTASYAHRHAMCELAMNPLPGAEVSRIEEELGGPSRTLDTLRELQQRNPGATLRLVVGSDLLDEVHRWHRWDQIAQLAPPIVIHRAGHASNENRGVALPPISSSALRTQIASGAIQRGWLPWPVEDYIAHHRLYQDDD